MNAKKITGIVLLSVSVFLFLALTTLFGKGLGHAIMGVFGVFGYPLFLFLGLVSLALINGARYQFSWKFVCYLAILVLCVSCIIHMSFTFDLLELGFAKYINAVYSKITPCGVLISFIVWPIQYLVFPVGAYVLLILTMAIMIALVIDYLHANKNFRKLSVLSMPRNYNDEVKKVGYKTENLGLTMGGFFDAKLKEGISVQPKPIDANIDENLFSSRIKNETIKNNEIKNLDPREEAKIKLGFGRTLEERLNIKKEELKKEDNLQINRNDANNILLTPKTVNAIPDYESAKKIALEMMSLKNQAMANENVNASFVGSVEDETTKEEATKSIEEPKVAEIERSQEYRETFLHSNFSISNKPPVNPVGVEEKIETFEEKIVEDNKEITDNLSYNNEQITTQQSTVISDESLDEIIKEIQTQNPELVSNNVADSIEIDSNFNTLIENEIINNNDKIEDFQEEKVVESELVKNFKQNFTIKAEKPNQESFFDDEKKEKNNKPTFTLPSNYIKPSLDILKTYEQQEDFDDEELKQKAEILEETLNNFKVPVNVVAITKGPAVTRFELQVQQGITVKKILQFSNDIAMALEAKGGIRIEAPIPGKNAVGVEVPNSKIQTIGLKDILSTDEFRRSSSLSVGLGRDIAGSTILCDIKQMPHLMVAGATGSGKSVCLSVLLVSLLYKLGPDDLKLILIDPKRVEFSAFNGLPHMLLPEAITEPKDAISALTWAMNEMDRRFTLFHELKVNKIDDYNSREEVRTGKEPKLPTIVIVIDELADLIMTAKRDVEEKIRRLSQLARAAGIHLVVATQRPSVDVITGTIKANLPSRIAFMVSSGPDSKTILDQYGAENLLGKGDMLYSPSNYSEPRRVQCAFVSGDEVRAVVENIKQNNTAIFDENVKKEIFKKEEEPVGSGADFEDSKAEFDSILPDALKLAIETRQASVSMIQRRFAVGYSRAARILDQMERMKFVSASDGSKARSVYITMDEFNAIFGDKE